jgi:hypothetical protein
MVQTDLTSVDQTLLQVVGPARRIRIVDSTSGETVSELPNPRPGDLLCGLHATEAGVWLGYEDPPLLELRSWPDLVLHQRISVGRKVAGVTVVGRYVAFAEYAQARIHLLDPRTEQIAISIGVNGNPTGLTWDGRHIWYCDYTTVQLRAIDVPGIVARLRHLPPSSTRHLTVLGAPEMIRAVNDD